MSADPFVTLGLGPGAGADEVRDARRRLAKDHHPDQGGDAERMRMINEAADAALAELARRDATTAADHTAEPAAPPAASDHTDRRPGPSIDDDGRRMQRDVPSFTVDALPVDTFEALLIAAAWLGEAIDDDPPYRLDAYLSEPYDCWCRLDVVPDAGSSTVGLTIGSIDGRPVPDVVTVRDAWVDALNSLSAPPPS